MLETCVYSILLAIGRINHQNSAPPLVRITPGKNDEGTFQPLAISRRCVTVERIDLYPLDPVRYRSKAKPSRHVQQILLAFVGELADMAT